MVGSPDLLHSRIPQEEDLMKRGTSINVGWSGVAADLGGIKKIRFQGQEMLMGVTTHSMLASGLETTDSKCNGSFIL